ncbi:Uncharacterised protein [Mycobacteroides abscessus subsp. abscessus]|nr:Uncharacterised protein [Mycobacteroides abscessus subsp. abscessus]
MGEQPFDGAAEPSVIDGRGKAQNGLSHIHIHGVVTAGVGERRLQEEAVLERRQRPYRSAGVRLCHVVDIGLRDAGAGQVRGRGPRITEHGNLGDDPLEFAEPCGGESCDVVLGQHILRVQEIRGQNTFMLAWTYRDVDREYVRRRHHAGHGRCQCWCAGVDRERNGGVGLGDALTDRTEIVDADRRKFTAPQRTSLIRA